MFSKANKIARARRAIAVCDLWKNLQVHIYSIAREKSCDYVLIIHMKKYEMAYHNYAEAERAHQVQK